MKCRLLAFALVLSLLACAPSREVQEQLDSAEIQMTEHPEQALALLSRMDRKQLTTSAVKARHALLYAQALDKNGTDVDRDTLTRCALDYYERRGPDRERALACYYHGCVCMNAGDDSLAVRQYVRASHLAAGLRDPYLRGLIHSRMGNLYEKVSRFEEATANYRTAERCFREAGSLRNVAISLANQGSVAYLTSQASTAREKWSAARKIYLEIGDSDRVQAVDIELFLVRMETEEASPALKASARQLCLACYGEPLPWSAAGMWMELYKRMGELDSARLCGLLILKHRSAFSARKIAGCYAQLTEIERLRGNYKEALQYGYAHSRLSDSLQVLTEKAAVKRIEHRYDNQLLRESVDRLRLERKTYLLTILVALLLALGGGVLLLRWRCRVRNQMENARAELAHLNSVYDELVRRHEAVKRQSDSRSEREQHVSRAIEERLNGLRQLIEEIPTTKPALFIQSFKKQMTVQSSSKYALLDLQYVVNQKYYGIIDHLKAQYPELNKQDLDLCALMCFGFSHAGICFLYDYADIGSFYNKRSRLRHKLHLPQDYKIEEFIERCIAQLRDRE